MPDQLFTDIRVLQEALPRRRPSSSLEASAVPQLGAELVEVPMSMLAKRTRVDWEDEEEFYSHYSKFFALPGQQLERERRDSATSSC